jgi:hypothetical protein
MTALSPSDDTCVIDRWQPCHRAMTRLSSTGDSLVTERWHVCHRPVTALSPSNDTSAIDQWHRSMTHLLSTDDSIAAKQWHVCYWPKPASVLSHHTSASTQKSLLLARISLSVQERALCVGSLRRLFYSLGGLVLKFTLVSNPEITEMSKALILKSKYQVVSVL